jgi:hypothetical protein
VAALERIFFFLAAAGLRAEGALFPMGALCAGHCEAGNSGIYSRCTCATQRVPRACTPKDSPIVKSD